MNTMRPFGPGNAPAPAGGDDIPKPTATVASDAIATTETRRNFGIPRRFISFGLLSGMRGSGTSSLGPNTPVREGIVHELRVGREVVQVGSVDVHHRNVPKVVVPPVGGEGDLGPVG